METLKDGSFTFVIESKALSLGLRPSKRSPRNMKFLVECSGMVGQDGTLSTIPDLSEYRLDTSVITDGFPFPQIFVFNRHIVVCGKTKIYEYVNGELNEVLDIGETNAGSRWEAVDAFDLIYMVNGIVVIARDHNSGSWSYLPYEYGKAAANYNGQILLGFTEGS